MSNIKTGTYDPFSIVRNPKNKSTLTYFPGVLVLGLSHSSEHDEVAVWTKGAMLSDEYFRPHQWPNWGNAIKSSLDGAVVINDDNNKDKKVIRHYAIAPHEVIQCTKAEICKEMGIEKLNSSQQGFKFYYDTNIGDVLYVTYDTNISCYIESVRYGFIDRKTKIHYQPKTGPVTGNVVVTPQTVIANPPYQSGDSKSQIKTKIQNLINQL